MVNARTLVQVATIVALLVLGIMSIRVRSHLALESRTLVGSPLYTLADRRQAYGPGVNADGLANTQLGGTDCSCARPGTRISYRFRATAESLDEIRIFVQDGNGYSGGNGGSIRVELQGDDGTAEHAPSGKIVAAASLIPGNPVADHFPKLSFTPPAQLSIGSLYHLVFTNTDPNPHANFQSLNALVMDNPETPNQPRYLDLDWAELINAGSGWHVRSGFSPILQLHYINGGFEGIGYVEVWRGSAKVFSAASAIREVISVSGENKTVESAHIRIRRIEGTGTLETVLQQADGTILGRSAISSASVSTTQRWVRFDFSNRPVLASRTKCYLILKSSGTAAFETFPIRRGTEFGFSPASVYADGHAEFQDGSEWRPWRSPWGRESKDVDLQFYLVVADSRDPLTGNDKK